jgi:hypothetical protein
MPIKWDAGADQFDDNQCAAPGYTSENAAIADPHGPQERAANLTVCTGPSASADVPSAKP